MLIQESNPGLDLVKEALKVDPQESVQKYKNQEHWSEWTKALMTVDAQKVIQLLDQHPEWINQPNTDLGETVLLSFARTEDWGMVS